MAAPHDVVIVGQQGNPARQMRTALKKLVRSRPGPIGVALYDAGLTDHVFVDDARPTRATSRIIPPAQISVFQQTWQAAMAARAGGAQDVLTVLRKYGHVGTKKNATLLLFAPDAGFAADPAGMGKPEHEALDLLDNGMRATLLAGLNVHFRGHIPANFRLRLEFMYTTRDAGDYDDGDEPIDLDPRGPPQVLMGPQVLDCPRLFFSKQLLVHAANLNQTLDDEIDEFKTYIEDTMPRQSSNRAFQSLVAVYMWAVPTNIVNGGSLYGMARVTATQVAINSGIHALLAHSQGLFLNKPEVKDAMCIARAVMTALDFDVACRLDTHAALILKSAAGGAARWLSKATKEHAKAQERGASANVQASRLLAIYAAQNAVKQVCILEADVKKTFAALKLPFSTNMEKIRQRYSTIEKDLAAALVNRHPLINLSDPFFKQAQPLNLELMNKLRAAVKPPAQIKFQIWAPGVAGRVGVVYSDKPTLDFVLGGGRVVNLMLGDQHASVIRNVNACLNHTSEGAASAAAAAGVSWAKNRITCPLCGYHLSAGNPEAAWRIFEHQERGCLSTEGVKFTAPLSPSNLRQLSGYYVRALNRPLLLGTLATATVPLPEAGEFEAQATFAAWAAIPGKLWHTLGPSPEWDAMRLRARTNNVADVLSLSEAVLKTPPTYTSFATRGEEDPLIALLKSITKVVFVDMLLAQLRFKCPKDHLSLAALTSTAPKTCFCCQRPCTEPSKWSLQAARFKALKNDVDMLEPDDEEDEAELEIDTEEDPDKVVVHHCHATGECFYAHSWCNTLMIQSSSELMVEVDSNDTMARIADAVCKKEFIEDSLKGCPPRMSEHEGILTRVAFKALGTPYGLDAKPQILTVVFRPRSAHF